MDDFRRTIPTLLLLWLLLPTYLFMQRPSAQNPSVPIEQDGSLALPNSGVSARENSVYDDADKGNSCDRSSARVADNETEVFVGLTVLSPLIPS